MSVRILCLKCKIEEERKREKKRETNGLLGLLLVVHKGHGREGEEGGAQQGELRRAGHDVGGIGWLDG